MQFEITAVVVGAGVVGLACARRLALEGIDTLVIEAEGAIVSTVNNLDGICRVFDQTA